MRTIDFSPLFRHSVGFDRLQRLADSALQSDSGAPAYPPYNIEQVDEDGYNISMAVAGFSEADIDVIVTENTLVVTGRQPDADSVKYLHRGIAGRAFERRFELADHIKVSDASLVNGLLRIDLVREIPEEKKPRSIAINTKAIPHKKAA
ncbi:MAG: Hsp20 family protein [Rhodospirillaceae bacterium]|jgi:molecular chaperone IbpA|nr:Hsp20 family protein [Rhodospirillaceae bacterium]MBT3910497.1 Hsp20 family protein [Rhodospirillaceae bacterium]MBT5298800.1 Hsp20 family protein [Rhodospirillaceae bacterium]MBT5512783.1 Hsp20 family protein [Rhodospirillaceae bacterium]MBT6085592.1 Hsp20 family protein [Rhodospirillaceae bacterium]